MTERALITESMKVANLLELYPELEEVLIGIAPPFKKLKNPLLRRSVAKVATLRQAAAVAKMRASDLVNRLRAEVGQPLVVANGASEDSSYLGPRPAWFSHERVVDTVVESMLPDTGSMPIVPLLKRANQLADGEILELRTGFIPAPGIDVMKRKGFQTWTKEENPGSYRSYFTKAKS